MQTCFYKYILKTIPVLLLLLYGNTYGQKGVITGLITDDGGIPLMGVTVSQYGADNDVLSDSNGNYLISVPAGRKSLTFKLVNYEAEFPRVEVKAGDTVRRDIVLKSLNVLGGRLDTAFIENRAERGTPNMVRLNMQNANINPSPIGGVEGLLKTMLGDQNELTSQYRVRGGNYDENLVYVNDFQIYRPFLVRSGQQEGLSFINSDLVDGVLFSSGGFQAKYGDKMASVLDVNYKRPDGFHGSLMLSLLGAQAHLEGSSRNKKFAYMIGARQKSNQYLLKSQPTKGQYTPSFTDIQILLNYHFNSRWETEIIANYARNRFDFQPVKSEEAFGYVNEAYKLMTDYRGNERDQFDSRFAGWSLTYRPSENDRLKLLASIFQTNEFETYDISGEYFLTQVQTDLGKEVGEDLYSLGTGIIHNYARNYLTANVANVALHGNHSINRHYLLWGLEGNFVQVADQLMEWERRDSAGYTVPASDTALVMNYVHRANNQLNYSRVAAFVQDNILLSRKVDMTLNIGIRANYSMLNDELVISPRIQYAVKPNWRLTDSDMVFRLAVGMYAQPPFYREMRDFNGGLNTEQLSQKSYQASAGLDYNFRMLNDRPFKITFEAYYKHLWDLVPYEFDNVRIRYYPFNTAKGYAYGAEARLFGALARNSESWISVGYMKTANQILDTLTGQYTAAIPRPTDQRMNFGMFFSDYLPRNKNFKMFLNMVYATGLPFSVPGKALTPGYQVRIPDYKRVDIGFAALLLDGKKPDRPAYSIFSKFESIWLSLEVFNLLGIQNTLSYQWIQDYSTQNTFAVPNRLTSRLINAKLALRF